MYQVSRFYRKMHGFVPNPLYYIGEAPLYGENCAVNKPSSEQPRYSPNPPPPPPPIPTPGLSCVDAFVYTLLSCKYWA